MDTDGMWDAANSLRQERRCGGGGCRLGTWSPAVQRDQKGQARARGKTGRAGQTPSLQGCGETVTLLMLVTMVLVVMDVTDQAHGG